MSVAVHPRMDIHFLQFYFNFILILFSQRHQIGNIDFRFLRFFSLFLGWFALLLMLLLNRIESNGMEWMIVYVCPLYDEWSIQCIVQYTIHHGLLSLHLSNGTNRKLGKRLKVKMIMKWAKWWLNVTTPINEIQECPPLSKMCLKIDLNIYWHEVHAVGFNSLGCC